jgi:hypothetical protein
LLSRRETDVVQKLAALVVRAEWFAAMLARGAAA